MSSSPRLDVIIYAVDDRDAKSQAVKMAKAPASSSYYAFQLWRTPDKEQHVRLGNVHQSVVTNTAFIDEEDKV